MGLDITVYTDLRKVGTCETWNEYEAKYDEMDGLWIHPKFNQGFKQHADGSILEAGAVFAGNAVMSFRAGSYSGYNGWREWLCRTVLDITPREIWTSKREDIQSYPFYWLINFSDCEGIIAGDAIMKLVRDFQKWEVQVMNSHAPDPWYHLMYTKWKTAFEQAGQTGAVEFH